MSATIVTFANLGKKRNLATDSILPVINTFAKKGELEQVICQINTGFNFEGTISAIPTGIRYLLRVLEKISRISMSRRKWETLFDIGASLRLKNSNVVFLHRGAFLPKTLKKAQMRSIGVEISGTAHFSKNSKLEKDEMEKLGIKENNILNPYTQLATSFSHLNKFDYVVTLSDFVKLSYLESSFPSKNMFVAYPDADIQRFIPRKKEDGVFRVLYVGYTTMLKGLHYLLDAWEDLDLPNSELVLVGGYGKISNELRSRYEKRINRNSNIKSFGHTNTPEEYYKNTSVMVFPSLTEGFGKVTLEAMACGLPVITTENAKGIVEDGKTGFVVPIRDSQAIKEKIEYLYHNPDVREKMGREARKAVENKKPFGEAVYEIYQEILRREGKTQ
jgi:glycosyltransferase involved in cell wall biosynthesis